MYKCTNIYEVKELCPCRLLCCLLTSYEEVNASCLMSKFNMSSYMFVHLFIMTFGELSN